MKHLFVCSITLLLLVACTSTDWRYASREPAGIAADPSKVSDAIIEVYAADAFSWRGWFAVHTWIAIKYEDAAQYEVFEVVGWRVDNGLSALRKYSTPTPDRYWYGAEPEKVLSIKGLRAKTLIPKVLSAIERYPYADEYKVVPGPNSNTFPAWVGLQVPELELDMPFSAIGSGYASKEQ